jgi:hypothetical protein
VPKFPTLSLPLSLFNKVRIQDIPVPKHCFKGLRAVVSRVWFANPWGFAERSRGFTRRQSIMAALLIVTNIFKKYENLIVATCLLFHIHAFLDSKYRNGSRGSSGSVVSDYGLDYRAIEVRSPTGLEDVSSSPCVQTGSGAHPASCPMGTRVCFPGGKAWPGCDADHSPPSCAEVKYE